uniref:hypothetical protein n=1 Tax=Clostridium sp. NkU-1 TaxID=1095009 RepID=UPI0006D0915B
MDMENERKVQLALHELVQGKTVIVAAHRLKTVAGAKQILVMDHGKLLDSGTHSALLQRCPHYTRLWNACVSAETWSIGGMNMIKLLRRVLKMSGNLKPRILWGFAFGFMDGIFNIFPLIAIFYAVNSSISGREVAVTTGILLIGLMGRILFHYLLSRFQSSAGFEMVAENRLKIGNLLRQAPMSFF